jgi:metacaspase-1
MFRMMWRRSLKVGSRGEDVRTVQELLRTAGFEPGPIDGIFGQRTQSATINFQRSKGLDADGVVGPKTWAALTAPPTTDGPVKGLSLHIGLNRVDDNAYGMAVPPLRGCENDARDMLALARAQQFEASQLLLTPDATVANVTRAISDAASTLKAGDFFLLTYSGHGSQMRDATGEEPDGLDETWVCYDRQLLDDELYALWGQFQPGVRIVVLSDSCHSGTVTRDVILAYQALASSYHDSREVGFVLETPTAMPLVATRDVASMSVLRESVREVMPGVLQRLYAGTRVALADADVDEHVNLVLRQLEADNTRGLVLQESPVTRNLPSEVAWFDFDRRRSTYRNAKLDTREARPPTAKVLLISGCQDNQLSLDGQRNGLFTQRLLEVWDQGRFHGIGYPDLHRQIISLMPPQQTPSLFWATPQDPVLEQQRPFTVQVS